MGCLRHPKTLPYRQGQDIIQEPRSSPSRSLSAVEVPDAYPWVRGSGQFPCPSVFFRGLFTGGAVGSARDTPQQRLQRTASPQEVPPEKAEHHYHHHKAGSDPKRDRQTHRGIDLQQL